jgi:lipoprotein-releasing system ATP-binding protein
MLEAFNIKKTYSQLSKPLEVLKGIDLKIDAGEAVTIVGPSGAGKSTFLHILGGLDRPTGGDVSLNGRNLYKITDNQRAKIRNRQMGFVFQFYHLLPEFTALENVLLPIMVKENAKNMKNLKEKGMHYLRKVGLLDRKEHKPYQLSGGEQQRVAIARALINDPAIIFCDEPTGNLDSHSGQEIINLLMELNQHNQQTLVIVTHDKSIAKLSHRTISMMDGKLIS